MERIVFFLDMKRSNQLQGDLIREITRDASAELDMLVTPVLLENVNGCDTRAINDNSAMNGNSEKSTKEEAQQSVVVSLQDVYFEYPQRPNNLVLNKINLNFFCNSINCVVGESGSGKSTILSLICGLYNPTNGNICIQGESIKSWQADGLHRLVGGLLCYILL
jgi:ABC-type multidrug transport system fused ATPase/permease subunit